MDINSIPFSYVYIKKMNTEWIVVQPPVYQRGDLYETQSVECGFRPDYEFQATYSDGRTLTVECDGWGILTYSDVKPEGYQASAMTDAVIGNCVSKIGRYAFSYCDGLTSINIPDNVHYIELHAFAGLKNLKTVHIGKGFRYAESSIFNGCEGLISITIEATRPPVLDDEFGNNWFNDTNNCPIYVPCQSLNAYKTASGWSQYADRLFGIPPCVQTKFILSYSDGRTYSKECDGISMITRDEVKPEGYEASAVTSITIGECVEYIFNADNVGATFSTNLTMVNSNVNGECNIPTHIVSIGDAAFAGCGFTTLNINGRPFLDRRAFAWCSNLTSITINSETPPGLNVDEEWQHPFYDTNNCPIYVPASAVNTYKTTYGWSWVADRIFPIT